MRFYLFLILLLVFLTSCRPAEERQANFCTDTDNGISFNLAGEVNSNSICDDKGCRNFATPRKYVDECAGDSVTEWFCENTHSKNVIHLCENGCSDSKCIEKTDIAGACPEHMLGMINLSGLTNLAANQLHLWRQDSYDAVEGITYRVFKVIIGTGNQDEQCVCDNVECVESMCSFDARMEKTEFQNGCTSNCNLPDGGFKFKINYTAICNASNNLEQLSPYNCEGNINPLCAQKRILLYSGHPSEKN